MWQVILRHPRLAELKLCGKEQKNDLTRNVDFLSKEALFIATVNK